jgi:hypothetical protein
MQVILLQLGMIDDEISGMMSMSIPWLREEAVAYKNITKKAAAVGQEFSAFIIRQIPMVLIMEL